MKTGCIGSTRRTRVLQPSTATPSGWRRTRSLRRWRSATRIASMVRLVRSGCRLSLPATCSSSRARKDERDTTRDEKLDVHFGMAVEALDSCLHTGGVSGLKVDQCKAILLVNDKKPKGNKPELQQQVSELLKDKTPEGTAFPAVVAEMKRLTEVAQAARAMQRPLALAAAPAPALLMGPVGEEGA
mmetsp:Transcript_55302/g.123627  ORF Transcript_55302/g.123627 Transcript_55302/m.123627 type:complete len:186 (-) Transcript_55302:78-635(-)